MNVQKIGETIRIHVCFNLEIAVSLIANGRIWFTLLFVLFAANKTCSGQTRSDITPLLRAHSHNDYQNQRPLLDAIDNGFCSVEADIFLVNGQLLVGHNRWSLHKEQTLTKLYLDQLQELVKKNDGRVYRNGPAFMLLIDIKEKGELVYPVLDTVLQNYKKMLSGIDNGKYTMRAIQIVISGSCPRKLIENDSDRLVAIDGRLSDLSSDAPAHLIPVISAHWGSHFKWRGKSGFNDEMRKKLKEIIRAAHESKRRVRFWGSPESTTVWQELVNAEVDHINTDELPELREFLLRNAKSKKQVPIQ